MKLYKLFPYLIIIAAVLFNLILYFPESKITLDPNDNVFQYALVARTNMVWKESHCPASPSCLPNLIDHWVPNWAEGYALPYYYSHLPQIFIVSTYNLIIQPLFSLLTSHFSLFQYYTWLKYLLLSLFPLPIFVALRIIGINPILAVISAFLGSHLSTDGLYGIDPASYLWRGYGLTSQLYSTFFIPLAIAFTYKALENLKTPRGWQAEVSTKAMTPPRWRNLSYTLWAIIFTTLSVAGHLGIGVILLLTLPVFIFFDGKKSFIITRAKKLAVIVGVSIFALSYWILPAMIDNTYHMISFWDPVWKFSSWGLLEVVRQFFTGEIFDWNRFPIITILVTIGFFTVLLNKKYFPFALAFLLWIFLYFGRTTWGGLIDLIPSMKDFHQSRFIVGVHIASLFLIPAGLEWLLHSVKNIFLWLANLKREMGNEKLDTEIRSGKLENLKKSHFSLQHLTSHFPPPTSQISLLTSIAIIIIILLLTLPQSVNYASLNNKWIYEANTAYHYQSKDFNSLLETLTQLPPGRIYTGRPGNWGRQFRYSSTQMYLALSVYGFPISQFLPESWSPNSDNEEMFDERIWQDYNLYNLRYLIAPTNFTPPTFAQSVSTFGPYNLYQIPTSGYFDVVSSNTIVKAAKTNFVNIVHVWQKSFTRLWNMSPLITLENKNPPPNIKNAITMTDLSNYTLNDNDKEYNLFASFPFLFPESTVSGKIVDSSHDKPNAIPVYSARVVIPANCQNCFTLFKMTYFPNWHATLDGKPVDIYPIFPFHMAVSTPPGPHTIEFTYHPSKLKIILLIIELGTLFSYLFRKKLKESPFPPTNRQFLLSK